jgi:hypothetical protein
MVTRVKLRPEWEAAYGMYMAKKSAISQYLAAIGSKGGKVKGVKKGFASLTAEERRQMAAKAAAGRRRAKKNAKKKTA